MKTNKKEEFITVRVEGSTKKELEKMAIAQQRSLSNFLQIILSDVAKKKIKITF